MYGFFPYAGAPFADAGTTSLSVVVSVTGVQAVGQLGTVSVNTDQLILATGVQAVGQVGDSSGSRRYWR